MHKHLKKFEKKHDTKLISDLLAFAAELCSNEKNEKKSRDSDWFKVYFLLSLSSL